MNRHAPDWRAAISIVSALGLALTVWLATRPEAPADLRSSPASTTRYTDSATAALTTAAPDGGTEAQPVPPDSSAAEPNASTPGVSTGATAPSSAASPIPSPSVPLVSASPASTPVAGPIYRVGNAGPQGLNVRAGPKVADRKLGVLHDGALVRLVRQAAPGWGEVAGDGFSGYVALQYLAGPLPATSASLTKLSTR